MTLKRDTLFPSTSIGRSQGRLSRTSSHETLAAHPLLSPSPDSPKYVPYTPRQRLTPTPTTTEASTIASVHHQPQGDATSKLQLMSLKAAAQKVGLDTGSVGWAILEKLHTENGENNVEWTEVWSAVTTGKATLLLPIEQASSNDKITASFVKDHVVLCDGSSRANAPMLTLSGFRGTLNGTTLTFRSSINPLSKQYHSLFSTTCSLGTLPPLPHISPTSKYPSYSLPSHTSSLPLPPRPAASKAPHLPPRPARGAAQASRLTNPFASLFGKSTPSTPLANTSLPDNNTSPTASIAPSESSIDHSVVIDVSAFTIDKKINRSDLAKNLSRALRTDVKESCAGLAPWITDRVLEFIEPCLFPVVKGRTKLTTQQRLQDTTSGNTNEKSSSYVINSHLDTPENLAEKMQGFFGLLEQDVRLGGTPFVRKREKSEGHTAEEEEEKWVQKKVESEGRIREIMETVERTICGLFYDRLFLQDSSDDASHDEALSSRVAALNMLDLGLEHLDIHVTTGMEEELYKVVGACGEALSQLDTACRTPADKAAVMVAAHKSLVDGLSRLPPIRLKSEEESKLFKERLGAEAELVKLASDATVALPTTADSNVEDQSAKDIVQSPLDVASDAPEIIVQSPMDIPTLEESPSKVQEEEQIPSTEVTEPKQTAPTPVSGDILLPLIIFAVVKANPRHFVSHLLYTQRFRNQNIGGEESYCLINLMAVAEFLENVDLAALGLGGVDKVVSTASLTPIPINKSPMVSAPDSPLDGTSASLRGRVEQQVDAITDSANKVITGVVDSFGILRSLTFLPGGTTGELGVPAGLNLTSPSPEPDPIQSSAPWNVVRPGLGLLRRETGFSIKGITSAVLPGRSTPKIDSESGQQLVSVTRPPSIRVPDHEEQDESLAGEVQDENEAESDSDEEDDSSELEGRVSRGDARSIRSFESMMKDRPKAKSRKSLSDRFAHITGVGLKGTTTNRSRFDTPGSSRPESPDSIRLAPPIQRFLDYSEEDIKVSEVGELLRDYKRLVEGIRAVSGFSEDI